MEKGIMAAKMLQPIHWTASARAHDVVARLGRTEDLCFSPANRRLAVVGFGHHRVSIFDITLERDGDGVSAALTGGVELASDVLQYPHGADFLDEDTLIVTNRSGVVCVFDLPIGAPEFPLYERQPADTPRVDDAILSSPGSVCVTASSAQVCELLICNNTGHTVTHHQLDVARRHVTQRSKVLLRKWLDVPDGVTQSADGQWIAVSNHNTHQVLLYDAAQLASEDADPDGILRGAWYPHGLRFSADARYLFLADAGAPLVHVYAADADGWRGVRYPVASLRIMDEATFERGHLNPEEGGPKGLALDRSSRVLAVTSEWQPLELFSVDAVMRACSQQASCAQKRHDVGTELELLVKQRGALRTASNVASELTAAVDYMQTSRSWRFTAPLRRLHSVLRRHRD
jgi:hypothetical protein